MLNMHRHVVEWRLEEQQRLKRQSVDEQKVVGIFEHSFCMFIVSFITITGNKETQACRGSIESESSCGRGAACIN